MDTWGSKCPDGDRVYCTNRGENVTTVEECGLWQTVLGSHILWQKLAELVQVVTKKFSAL